MVVRIVKGKFWVTSKSSDKVYVIGEDMACPCKGYKYRKRCGHQKQIQEYIISGRARQDVPANGAWLPSNRTWRRLE